jgi:hypothetical protein
MQSWGDPSQHRPTADVSGASPVRPMPRLARSSSAVMAVAGAMVVNRPRHADAVRPRTQQHRLGHAKMSLLAPMPSATVNAAPAVNPGARRR